MLNLTNIFPCCRFNRDRDQGRGRRGSAIRNGTGRGTSDNGRGQNVSRFNIRGRGSASNIRGSSLKGKQPGSGLRKVNWDLRSLEPLRKDFYVEHPTVRNRYRKYKS